MNQSVRWSVSKRTILLCAALVAVAATSTALGAGDVAKMIQSKGLFHGGVVVHVHGADTSLLESVHQQHPNMLGHLLVENETVAGQARDALVAAKLHGPITVSQWSSGRLPFIDNFVNLMIIDSASTVPREEVLRALAPEGTAIVGSETIVKPRPETIDDWPMQLLRRIGQCGIEGQDAEAAAAAHAMGRGASVVAPPRQDVQRFGVRQRRREGVLHLRRRKHLFALSSLPLDAAGTRCFQRRGVVGEADRPMGR